MLNQVAREQMLHIYREIKKSGWNEEMVFDFVKKFTSFYFKDGTKFPEERVGM